MKKRMFAAALAMAMMLGAGSAMACDGFSGITLNDGENFIETSGSYKLTENEAAFVVTIENGTEVTLCLNGYTLKKITVAPEASLTLGDCTGSGKVGVVDNYGTFTMNGGEATGIGVVTDSNVDNGVNNYGTFTMNGGKVTGRGHQGGMDNYGTFTMHDGEVTGDGESKGVDNFNNSTFIMYGGTVSATTKDQSTLDACGVYNKGEFSMSGNAQVWAQAQTGRAYGVYNDGKDSTFTMSGGKASGKAVRSNSMTYGVCNMDGTISMSGGEVTASGMNSVGVDNFGKDSTFSMSGGKVTARGQNVVSVYNSGKLSMSGGEITGDSIGVNSHGANTTFTMSGGEITGGSIGVSSTNNAKFTISAGTITGGEPDENAESFLGAVKYQGTETTEEEAAAACIAPGSYKVSGGFLKKSLVVAKIPQAAAAAAAGLPATGDPSLLLGWAALLGAAGAGLKLRRKK